MQINLRPEPKQLQSQSKAFCILEIQGFKKKEQLDIFAGSTIVGKIKYYP